MTDDRALMRAPVSRHAPRPGRRPPLVGEAVAEDVARAAVHDHQLAVVAAVDSRQVAQPERMVSGHLEPAPRIDFEQLLVHLRRAGGVQQHAHLYPRALAASAAATCRQMSPSHQT